MKKFNSISLLALAAAALLGSCSTDEVVDEAPQPQQAISFKAVADKPVGRAEISLATFRGFRVFGCVTDAGDPTKNHVQLFNNELVTATKDETTGITSWTYPDPQYWSPEKDYYFVALSTNVDDRHWKIDFPTSHAAGSVSTADFKGYGTVTFDNSTVNGDRDLVYSYAARTTGTNVAAEGKVDLTFYHMLSRIGVKVTNGIENSEYTIKLKNMKIGGVLSSGSVDLGVEPAALAWTSDATKTFEMPVSTSDVAITKGNAFTSESRFVIPGTQKWGISFDVEVYLNKVIYSSNTVTGTISAKEYKPGNSYMLTTTVTMENVMPGGAKPIEFNVVNVSNWTNGGDTAFEIAQNK